MLGKHSTRELHPKPTQDLGSGKTAVLYVGVAVMRKWMLAAVWRGRTRTSCAGSWESPGKVRLGDTEWLGMRRR